MGEPRVTANDFQMFGETTQDANNLEQSLLYLQSSPYATAIIEDVRGTDVIFNRVDLGADEALGNGSGVIWNPEAALQLANGDVMSPAVNLASEFAHLSLEGGLDPNPTFDPVWDNSAEAIAHQGANVIASELGEPLRQSYDNVDLVRTSDPTFSFSGASDLFDYGAFDASYGVGSFGSDGFGYDSGFDSFGSDSFGFDYGSFSSEYGIGDYGFDSFGGGSGGGGFFEYMIAV